jgi:hypothetical protein
MISCFKSPASFPCFQLIVPWMWYQEPSDWGSLRLCFLYSLMGVSKILFYIKRKGAETTGKANISPAWAFGRFKGLVSNKHGTFLSPPASLAHFMS